MFDINMDLSESIGNKAEFLLKMKGNGFNVPDMFVLSSKIFNDIVDYNKKRKNIADILAGLTKDNIRETSTSIISLLDVVKIPERAISDITKWVDNTKKYAVRSSGTKEDLEGLSFAGQYRSFLNVSGISEVIKAVVGCYKSMYEETSLSYMVDKGVDLTNLEMSVIIQEMVNSEVSGIAFTVNPLSGNDKEMVVEVTEGQGENIVGGRVTPESYVYNWFEDKYDYSPNNRLLNREELDNLMDTLLGIQMFFGYPCDIEFAYEADKLYILQARPITRIMYSEISDQWTTANFKDGGVSAAACKPYMWSLYEYVWEIILKKFLLETKLFREKDLRKLGEMYYGRPYWNLSVVKEAMANIPGFKEREFDSELGVTISYEGFGKTTKITPRSIIKIIQVALAQRKLTDLQNKRVEAYRNELLKKYYDYEELSFHEITSDNIESLWYGLIKDDYLQSECTYFWQIFINTIQQPLFRRSLYGYVDSSGYLDLIGGLNNVSHLMPFRDIWEISRKIVEDRTSYAFWSDSDIEDIKGYYCGNSKEYFIEELRPHIEKFGYHSERELDVSYPCYCEDIGAIIGMIKNTILLDDSYSPACDYESQYSKYCIQLEAIKKQVSHRRYNKLIKKIQKMRKMLWWREELKDVSIRFYYLVRIYTLKLAEYYFKNGIIKDMDDIWYLSISDLFRFIEKRIDADELGRIIERNRCYYWSFRNYMSDNEIGLVHSNKSSRIANSGCNITGIGCNSGIVTGMARVIEKIEEIDKLQPGDILVTKFTDTGWTSKLAILKGLITERGGMLCHAAIISREYGIPCIVSCSDVTKKIKDKSIITINGATGEITISG